MIVVWITLKRCCHAGTNSVTQPLRSSRENVPEDPRREEENRMKRFQRWKGNRGGEEDDLGPCNYLFCISIMQLHEYQSRARDGQLRRNEREIEAGLWGNDEAGKEENNCRCIFFQSSRGEGRWATFWLLHPIHVNVNDDAADRYLQGAWEQAHANIFWSTACSVYDVSSAERCK